MADDEGGFFSKDHQTNEGVWDAVNTIPGVGEVVNGVNAFYDVGNVINPDPGVDRSQAFRDLAQDATSAIPLIGRGLDFARTMYDVNASNDTSHDLVDGMLGGKGNQTQNQDEFNDDHPPTQPQVCQ